MDRAIKISQLCLLEMKYKGKFINGCVDTDVSWETSRGAKEEQITGQTVVSGRGKRCSKDRKLRS